MDKADESNILKVKSLSKSFKEHFWSKQNLVLDNLSFSIPKGSAVGFLGSNGSGKTTTFKCIMNFIKKDSGKVLFFNKALTLENKRRIGFLPERPKFYEEFTAEEILYFYASLKQELTSSLKDKIQKALKKFDLHTAKNKPLRTFSKGMIQKVGFLQALIPRSEIVILDEPFSGLDPESRFTCMEFLEEELKNGVSLFLSSHIFQDIEKICNHLILIQKGRLVFEGSFSKFHGLTSSNCQKILYLFKDEKKSLICNSEAEAQQELKKLLSQGAVILSLQKGVVSLEQKYQELMKKT